MDNLEKTEEAIKNGQSRENRRGNQEWTIQRHWQQTLLQCVLTIPADLTATYCLQNQL